MSNPPIPTLYPTDRDRYDPDPRLGELRDRRPMSRMIYHGGHEGWIVTSHELVRQVLSDVRFSSVPHGIASPLEIPGGKPLPPPRVPPGFFIRMDPPDHTRLRRMLTGVFTVRRMKVLEPRVAEIVTEHLDRLAEAGRGADLVANFALPVPSMVICELLGVPYADRDRFQRDSGKMLSLETDPQERLACVDAINKYIMELVADKRGRDDDDLLSDLIRRDELSDEELGGIGFLLLVAGHETTANMLSLGTLVLLEHRDQWEALVADPDLIPGMVEELLRYLSVIHIGPIRVASEDVELGGELVKAGTSVAVSIAAANRDPEKFADPDRMDVARSASGHLAFGHGVHQCLGQQLARIEMRIGFEHLIRRFPKLHLAVASEEIPLRSDMAIYGVHRMPVTW